MSIISDETKAMLRRFLEARDRRDELKIAATKAENEYREQEAEVHAALSEGIEGSLKIPLGDPYGTVSFVPKQTPYAKIINKEKLMIYLEQRALVDEYTEPSNFARGRLNELVREMDEAKEAMPPGLEISKKRFVQITRQKG